MFTRTGVDQPAEEPINKPSADAPSTQQPRGKRVGPDNTDLGYTPTPETEGDTQATP